MAVNYRTSLKTTRMTDVVNDIDSGTGAGFLEICTTGYTTVLATITFNDPCGTVSGAVLTFSGTPINATAANNGTAAIARIKNSSGTVICDGLTVGTGSENIVVSTTTFSSGATVTLNSATITHG